ncbi:MAG: hypothetical protein V3V20_10630 [Algisphaera sp.]
MNTPADNNPRPLTAADIFPIGRAALQLGGVVLVVTGLLYAGFTLAGQPLNAKLNLIAAAICGVSGILALIPVWLGSKASTHGGAAGFMAGILVRMALTGGIVLYLQWGTQWPHARHLSFWVAGWYLGVLLVEVKLISSYVLAVAPGPPRYPQAGHPGSTSAPEASPAKSS